MKARLGAIAAALAAGSFGSLVYAQPSDDELARSEVYPEHFAYVRTPQGDSAGQPLLYVPSTIWEAGRTLRVCFFGGTETVQTLIENVAQEWTGPGRANLTLSFRDTNGRFRDCLSPTGASQIRISFSAAGYWSLVGNESNQLSTSLQPSMNYYRLDSRYLSFTPQNVLQNIDPSDRGAILHEFGHALGLMHEHQDPRLACWDEIEFEGPTGAYAVFARIGWTRRMVDDALKPITDRRTEQAERFNPQSVMMYALEPAILRGGRESRCFVPPRTRLHQLDLATIAQLYPHSATVTLAEASLPAQAMMPLPASAAPAAHQTYSEQIVNDLQSGDAFVRRDARGRLAEYIEAAPASELARLIPANLASQSYRYQLGVAVALDRADVDLSGPIVARLNNARNATTDPTLRQALTRASGQ